MIKWDYYRLYVERCKIELDHLLNRMIAAYKNAYGVDYKLSPDWKINLVTPGQEGSFVLPEKVGSSTLTGIYDPKAYYDPRY